MKLYDNTDIGLSLAYRPRQKFGGMVVPAAIMGGAGLLGSIFGASSASKNNTTSMNFAAAQNQAQMDWQEKMYALQKGDSLAAEERANAENDRRMQLQLDSQKEMTDWIMKNYSSPAAQAKALRQAGFNPAMLLGGSSGFGAPSVSGASPTSLSHYNLPSPMSSPMMSPPMLQNEGAAFAQGLESISSSVSNVMQADKTSEETRRLRDTHDIFVETMLTDKLSKQTAQEQMALQLSLDKMNLPKKYKLELDKLFKDIQLCEMQADYYGAQSNYTKLQTRISEILEKKENIHLQFWRKELELNQEHTIADIALKKTEMTRNKAAASQFYASAGNLQAQTKTIDSLREFQTQLAKWDSMLAQQQHGQRDAKFSQELRILANEANSSDFMPDMVKEELRTAVKNNDWYVVRQILGIANTAVGAYGAYKGAKTGEGFVNAQDVRNQIQGDWLEWQKSRGQTYEIHGFK